MMLIFRENVEELPLCVDKGYDHSPLMGLQFFIFLAAR